MHTPGPWHVTMMQPIWINDQYGSSVACIRENGRPEAENEGNARLLAAAPELLAALKAMLEPWHERLAIHDRTGFLLPSEVHQARTIIAKATGNEL